MKTLIEWRAAWRIRWQLEFKAEDLWVGLFWRTREEGAGQWRLLEIWVCLVPCLPIHLEIPIR